MTEVPKPVLDFINKFNLEFVVQYNVSVWDMTFDWVIVILIRDEDDANEYARLVRQLDTVKDYLVGGFIYGTWRE